MILVILFNQENLALKARFFICKTLPVYLSYGLNAVIGLRQVQLVIVTLPAPMLMIIFNIEPSPVWL